MTGADHIDVQAVDAVQRFCHIRVFIRPYDVVKIVFGGAHIPFLVRDGAAQNSLMAVVGAERVAGEENAVLNQIGIHGVRPTQVGQHHEMQRFAA